VTWLTAEGNSVLRLVRREPGAGEVGWDPAKGQIDREALEGLDAVIHLAGDSIAASRWTPARKAELRRSREEPTRLLAETLAALRRPPATLVCASAIGCYGDRGAELLSEKSPAAEDFLGSLCQGWEAAAQPARDSGIRVVHARFGLVLSRAGGALAPMLRPFRLGLGGRLGPGTQFMSWVTMDDVLGAIAFLLSTPEMSGPVNVTAPEPVTNADFTRTLGRVLRRPTLAPAPAFALRLVFGEMADALLLSSTRVLPQRLIEAGYQFRFESLEPALRHVLGRPVREPKRRKRA
jgi:uncharacterized protein (TIGR01777 family)